MFSEEEKETVRKKALKDVTPAFLSLYYMTEFDDFSYCNGRRNVYAAKRRKKRSIFS